MGNTYYGYATKSAPFSGEIYDHETIRAIIDCIATHVAKAQALHIITDKDGRIKEIKRNSPFAKLLNQQPNPLMTGFDFKYKLISQLETRTTAAAYIKWNGKIAEMIIPLDYSSFELCGINGGGYAIKFNDWQGVQQILNIEDVIFLRKFYNARDASGDGNNPIYNTLDMIKSSDSGFMEAMEVSNKVRGLYRQKKAMLDPKDVIEKQDEFAQRFKEAAKSGGIVGVDSLEDYIPLNVSTYTANATQMKTVRENLYSYWRTPENIVKSDYTEQQGMAWYESVIEPHWLRMSEAFTNVCFTQKEKDFGNKIVFTGGVLMGTSYQTRINIITNTKETGLLTINEQRELLGYSPVEGGDQRLVSLNYINSEKQEEYQIGKEEK